MAYDYRWEMGLGNVISTDRNFEYIPTSCGQFDVNFYMTDRQTGLEFHASHTAIEVRSPYKVGWLILSEKDNRTSLSYIRRDSWIKRRITSGKLIRIYMRSCIPIIR